MINMKIAIIGLPGYVKNSYEKDIDNLFRSVGFNTGNLVYMHAVTQHILDEKDFFGWKIDANLINSEYDVLIFIGANQLHPNKDMLILAELFEAVNIPCFIIGLGVQANSFSQKMIFSKGTLRFIDVIKEKCSHISVRGEFTASVLTDYGATNVITTGCPSNFINFDPNLGQKIVLKNKNINSLVINTNLREDMYDFLSRVVSNKKSCNMKFIMQEPKLVLDFCRYKTKSHYCKQVIDKIHNNIMKEYSDEEVKEFAFNNFETFFNVEAWMEYLLRFDFSIGSRMHGNMLALQSGIPTVFLTHDSRLQELVEIMNLPHIAFDKVSKIDKIEDLLPMISFDEERYNFQRNILAKKFCEIYSYHGINIRKGLKVLGE